MNRNARLRQWNRRMTNDAGERRAGVEETRKGKDRVPEGRGFYAPAAPQWGYPTGATDSLTAHSDRRIPGDR